VDHDARHLNSATANLLVLSVEESIRAIRADRWVSIREPGKCLGFSATCSNIRAQRACSSVAIYGDSGMGKTMILEKFRLDHPPDFDPDSGKA